jgi:hypothetical protein
MRTTDLFNFNRSSKRLNESLHKTFGTKINFESFDTPKLEDARNKLRTQIHTARTSSGFNETVENEALTKAQFMHDAIVAELADREEHIVDTTVEEGVEIDKQELMSILKQFDEDMNEIGGYGDPDYDKILAALSQGDVDAAVDVVWYSYADQDGGELRDMDNYIESLEDQFKDMVGGTEEDYNEFPESAPPTAKGERMVKHIKQGYADDGKLTDKERGIAYATAWKAHNKNESIEQTGDDMRNLREGEIQQASAIVTAKTMVDRVGRWIEELSGMENDTLLQLGDSIRDEMGQEQAKAFIEAVAPAIQQALENLKTTRDTLSTGVRSLASGEQPDEMLGAEPEMGMGDEGGMDMAEPDMMNEPGMGDEEDAFAAAEPGAGGMETTGREQRESIDRQSRLMKILAG